MNPRSIVTIYFCILSLFSPLVFSEIDLSGFASFTGGKIISGENSPQNYDSDFSFQEESFIGIQASSDLENGFSVVTQLVSRGSDEWNTEVEWAYLGYEASDNVKILFGKQRIPYYRYSDFLDIGYAYHFIAPPEEAYFVPGNTLNGISAIINNNFGKVHSTFHAVFGRYREAGIVSGVESLVEAKNLKGFNWSLDYEWVNLRAIYIESDFNIEINGLEELAAGWAAAGQQVAALTNNPSIATEWAGFSKYILGTDEDNTAIFSGLSFTLDHGPFLFVSEYTLIETEGTVTPEKAEALYSSLGIRFGNFMPHVTYGDLENTASSTKFLDNVPVGLDASVDSLLATTEATFNTLDPEGEYYTLGLRWDFHPSAAFKIEYKTNKETLRNSPETTRRLFRFSVVTLF